MASVLERLRGRRDADRTRDTEGDGAGETRRRPAVVEEDQREEFGGTNWGAAFFGWLVAFGLGALLTAIVAAAGAAIGLTELSESEAEDSAETIGVVGAAALIAIALIAYYAGGYVAGRMSRFDGARQGFAVWLWAVVVAVILAILGAIAGSEYNVLETFDLPRIPIDEGDLTVGGAIALAALVLGSLLAAIAGGKSGERYHRRVDRVGFEGGRDR
jgi:hypothetical protein